MNFIMRGRGRGSEMERYGANEVRELLLSRGIKLSKSRGQNFLTDANIPEKIVRLSGIDRKCGVLETGPGLGALTLALRQEAGYVTAVEIDSRLLPILRERLNDANNVKLVHGDILKLDIVKLVTENMPGMTYHACANLPYSITTPALAAFINADVFETITVMVQKEVAERICAVPGKPEYGAFTVFANCHMEPKILFDVPPECFVPRPGIYSSVVTMNRRQVRLPDHGDYKMFIAVVRAAFGQRRKTLVNALYAVFGDRVEKEYIEKVVRLCGFDTKVRGETLNIDEFARISELLKLEIDRQKP